jgi:hypothetical protein
MSTAEPFDIGYWLSSEEHGRHSLVESAVQAEAHSFGHQIGPDQRGFLEFWSRHVAPLLATGTIAATDHDGNARR